MDSTFGGKLHVDATTLEIDVYVKARACGLDNAWMVTKTKHDPMLFLEIVDVIDGR